MSIKMKMKFNDAWKNTAMKLDPQRSFLECMCKKLPPKVKKYIAERCGKNGADRLDQVIRSRTWILLTGPDTTGKTTIRDILWAIGYPYVIDDNGLGRSICACNVLEYIEPEDSIFEKLEIE